MLSVSFLFALSLLATVSARRDGVPECIDLPGHGRSNDQLQDQFFVSANASQIIPGDTVAITMNAPYQSTYKGFHLWVQYDGSSAKVGYFTVDESNTDVKLSPCPNAQGVTHTSNKELTETTVLWTLPVDAPYASNYTIHAMMVQNQNNYFDVTNKIARGELTEVPEQPGISELYNAGSNSLQVNLGSVSFPNRGPSITGVTVQVDDAEYAQCSNLQLSVQGTGAGYDELLCDVENLQPSTTYKIQVVATNNEGASEPGQAIEFATLPANAIMPPEVGVVNVDVLGPRAVNITWEHPEIGTDNAYIIGYKVKWRYYTVVGASSWSSVEIRPDSLAVDVTIPKLPIANYLLDVLSPGVTYDFEVTVLSFLGESTSPIIIQKTMDQLSGADKVCSRDCTANGGTCKFGECFCGSDDGIPTSLGPICDKPAVARCFRKPSKFCLSWVVYYDESLKERVMDIAMYGVTNGWLGVLFNPEDGRMKNADTIIGWVDDTTGETFVEDRYSTATGAVPQLDTDREGTNDVFGVRGSSDPEQGTTTIQFRRLVLSTDVSNDFTIDLNNPEVTVGWALGEDDTFSAHSSSDESRGTGLVDFSATPGEGPSTVNSLGDIRSQMIMVHVITMLLAFGLLFPLGALIAVRARVKAGDVVKHTARASLEDAADVKTDERVTNSTGYFRLMPKHFQGHRGIQFLAALICFLGVASILAAPGREFRSNPAAIQSSHSGLGLMLTGMVLAQVVVGIFFHGDSAHAFHRYNGILLLILGITKQLPSGLELKSPFPEGSEADMLVPVLSGAIFLVGYIVVSFDKIRSSLGLEQSLSWHKFVSGIDTWLTKSFYRVGLKVARNPKKTMVISLVCCLLPLLGVTKMYRLTTNKDQYMPQTSVALKELEILEEVFPQFVVDAVDIQMVTNEDENILTKENLLVLLGLQRQIEKLVEPVSNSTFEEVCYFSWPTSGCTVRSILQLWGHNEIEIAKDGNVLETADVEEIFWPPAASVLLGDVLGGIERNEAGEIISARSFRVQYLLSGPASDDMQRTISAFVDECEALLTEKGLSAFTFTLIATSDEINRAISGDISLFALAVATMILFSMATLGDADVVRSKASVAVGGVLSVVLSIGAGFGLSMFYNFPFTSIHLILPYIIIGIGLDDMYIIMGEIRHEQTREFVEGTEWLKPNVVELQLHHNERATTSLERRIARGLAFAGSSVWMTSITDIAAFSMGIASLMPAVQSFCFYAAWCVLIDFLMQITFFLAIVVLDTKREQRGRLDCLCCLSGGNENEEENLETESQYSSNCYEEPKHTTAHKRQLDMSPVAARRIQGWLLSKPVKAAVMLLWVVLAAAAGFFAVKIEAFQDEWETFPDDSRFLLWNENDMAFFSESDIQTYFVMLFDVDFSEENQARVFHLVDNFVERVELTAEPYNWVGEFRDWARNNSVNALVDVEVDGMVYDVIRADLFYPLLDEYLDIPYLGDITKKHINFDCLKSNATATEPLMAVSESGCLVGGTLIRFPAPNSQDSGRTIYLSGVVRKVCEESGLGDGKCITFARDLFNADLYLNLLREVFVCVGGALAAVTVVSQVSMVRPLLGIITSISVGVIDIQVLALMYLSGLTLNAVTLIVLVMSIGISFDHLGHVVHAYMHTFHRLPTATRDERVTEALLTVGPSVFRSVFSTFLGVCYLGLAGADIFRKMFLGFLAVVVVASIHAFIFVPVILSLVGPVTDHEEQEEAIEELEHVDDSDSMDKDSSVESGTENNEMAGLPSRGRKLMWGCRAFILLCGVMLFVLFNIGFFSPPAMPGSGVTSLAITEPEEVNVTFLFDQVEVPEVKTSYICQGFELPVTDSEYHFLGSTVHVDKAEVVHHMILYSCTSPYSVTPKECSSMPRSCASVSVAWALSEITQMFPDGIGQPMGRGTTSTFFALQMHYDNYNQLAGLQDSSGLTLHLSKNLQPKTAAGIFVGSTRFMEPMPPGLPAVDRYTVCPLVPTDRAPKARTTHLEDLIGDLEYVTIFRVALHMHETGKKAAIVVLKEDDTIRKVIEVDTAYNFESQEWTYVEETKLYKTDKLMMRCEYDTTERSEFTLGGDGTEDEMCITFVGFYPRPPSMDEDVSLSTCVGDTEGFEIPEGMKALW